MKDYESEVNKLWLKKFKSSDAKEQRRILDIKSQINPVPEEYLKRGEYAPDDKTKTPMGLEEKKKSIEYQKLVKKLNRSRTA